MITTLQLRNLQLRKAADMRSGSKMSWEAIAEVIDVPLEELMAAVEKHLGKAVPRETWGQPPRESQQRGAASAFVQGPPVNVIEGFVVELDAGPPPPKLGDGKMQVLAQKLKPGAKVMGMKHGEFLALRRGLTKLGMGSVFRWEDKEKGIVTGYVLAEPTPQQRKMSELMKERARVGASVGRPKAKKK